MLEYWPREKNLNEHVLYPKVLSDIYRLIRVYSETWVLLEMFKVKSGILEQYEHCNLRTFWGRNKPQN